LEHQSFNELLNKYLNNACTPAEVDQLMELLGEDSYAPETQLLLQQAFLHQLEPTGYSDDEALRERLEQRLNSIMQQTGLEQPRRRKVRMLTWVMAAAVLVLLAGGSAWFFLLKEKTVTIVSQPVVTNNDVLPGGDKAILTLADGSKVILDSAGNGLLAQQGSAQVMKTANGQLAYINKGTGTVVYNTMSTPRGGQYQLTLPDGSKVWLNAASSIHYPTAFTGNERRVAVTGEAYFEVTKHAAMPFVVEVNNKARVEVLGTHFNINAYDDEPVISTTLLEGKVKFVNGGSSMVNGQKDKQPSVTLQPGQQAQLPTAAAANDNIIVKNAVDIEQVMAWKNQLFRFDDAELPVVMRQLARWYDVEIVYDKKAVLSETFAGEMQRSLRLSQVLKGLEGMNVHFKIEGHRLKVLP
jgi:ferric-dicitrate binding protein FerR (iron transport regulator)